MVNVRVNVAPQTKETLGKEGLSIEKKADGTKLYYQDGKFVKEISPSGQPVLRINLEKRSPSEGGGYKTTSTVGKGSKEVALRRALGDVKTAKTTAEAQRAVNKISSLSPNLAKQAITRYNKRQENIAKLKLREAQKKLNTVIEKENARKLILRNLPILKVNRESIKTDEEIRGEYEKGLVIPERMPRRSLIPEYEKGLVSSAYITREQNKLKLTQAEYNKVKKELNKIQNTLKRSERVDNIIDKAEDSIENILSKSPGLKGNNFVQSTIKKLLSGAVLYLNPITAPAILYGRGLQLVDQAWRAGAISLNKDIRNIINRIDQNPKAYQSLVKRSAKDALKSTSQGFDPRTPQGLANDLLILLPLGVATITKLKPQLVETFSKSAGIPKTYARQLINTIIDNLKRSKGIKSLKNTVEYKLAYSKVKNAIIKAKRELKTLEKKASKIKKLTKKELENIDKLVFKNALKKAKETMTKIDIKRLGRLSKLTDTLSKRMNYLNKKYNNLIKSRKNIKGVFNNKRVINNYIKRTELLKQIINLRNKLRNNIKNKKNIFDKANIKEDMLAIKNLKYLERRIKKDQTVLKDLKTKIDKIKLENKTIKKNEDIFIKRAIEDLKKKEYIRKNFIKEYKKILKDNSKAYKAYQKARIKNKVNYLEKFNKYYNNRIKTYIKKFKDYLSKNKKNLKKKKTDIFIKEAIRNFEKEVNSNKRNIIKSFKYILIKIRRKVTTSRVSKLKPVISKKLKLYIGKRGKVKLKKGTTIIEFKKPEQRIFKVYNQLKTKLNTIKRSSSELTKNNINKVKSILRDEINLFKQGISNERWLKKLLNEEKRIKQALKQRRTQIKRESKLEAKYKVLDELQNKINNLNKDLIEVSDRINILRLSKGLDAGYTDITRFINKLITKANKKRANKVIKNLRERTKTKDKKIENKVINNNKNYIEYNQYDGTKLRQLIETENIQPVLNAINPNKYGRGFSLNKIILGAVRLTKQVKIKPRIKSPTSRFKPTTKIKPILKSSLSPTQKRKAISIIDNIIKADTITDVKNIVKQQPKQIQKQIQNIAEKQILRLRKLLTQKPKKKPRKIILLKIRRKKKELKLNKGEKYTYNLRIKRAGTIRTIKSRLPRNKALKKLRDTLDNSIARSGEIYIVGKTKSKDIERVSLKGFRKKKSKDPKVLKLVETARQALNTKRERQQLNLARRLKQSKRLKTNAKKTRTVRKKGKTKTKRKTKKS